VERKLAILPVALSCFVHRRRGLAKVEDLDPTSSRAVAEYLSVLDMDVEATTAIRQVEVGAAKTMLDRTAEEFDVQPSRCSPTRATARPRCWAGWWMSAESSRT